MTEQVNVKDDARVKEFIEFYKTLTEKEKFAVGSVFKAETGGDLSPYDSPKNVGVALIQVQDGDNIKLVGVIRGIPPNIGENALPGGFASKLEPSKLAAVREAEEELGFITNPNDYVFFAEHMSPRNVNLVFYLNTNVYPKEILNTFVLNEEVQGFVLLDENTPLAFPLHKQVVEDAIAYLNPQLKNSNKNKLK